MRVFLAGEAVQLGSGASTSSMTTTPFLTSLDSRAAVKGSRDPLGVQPIWTRFGRHLIGNLSTVTTSVRDFAVLLLGYHFAEQVASRDSGEDDLSVFLKWEQLAAYARGIINNDWAFRGVERAKANSQGDVVQLSTDANCQILSNQKIYGLWGLYTMPARASHLLEGSPSRLTPAAREMVATTYLPIFTKAGFKDGDIIARRLSERMARLELEGRDRPLLELVGQVLSRKRVRAGERACMWDQLVLGGPNDSTRGRQAALAEALLGTEDVSGWCLSASNLRGLAGVAGRQGETGEMVARGLEDVCTCELVLAPAAALFDFMLGCEGRSLDQIASDVRSAWGARVRSINPEQTQAIKPQLQVATNSPETGCRWVRIGELLAEGDYVAALRLLLDQNRWVMDTRGGGAPWMELRDGKLSVRFQDQRPQPLPTGADLPEYWRNPYFIWSLRAIAHELRN